VLYRDRDIPAEQAGRTVPVRPDAPRGQVRFCSAGVDEDGVRADEAQGAGHETTEHADIAGHGTS
jgi:hypothetical protein